MAQVIVAPAGWQVIVAPAGWQVIVAPAGWQVIMAPAGWQAIEPLDRRPALRGLARSRGRGDRSSVEPASIDRRPPEEAP